MKKTKVTFYNGECGVLAVFMEQKKMSGLYTCFSTQAQMHSCTGEYFNKLELATPEEYLMLMVEIIREYGFDLDVFNVRSAGWLGAAIRAGHTVLIDGHTIDSETLRPMGNRLQFRVIAIREAQMNYQQYEVTTLNVAGS